VVGVLALGAAEGLVLGLVRRPVLEVVGSALLLELLDGLLGLLALFLFLLRLLRRAHVVDILGLALRAVVAAARRLLLVLGLRRLVFGGVPLTLQLGVFLSLRRLIVGHRRLPPRSSSACTRAAGASVLRAV
jgi:hypothetical protein